MTFEEGSTYARKNINFFGGCYLLFQPKGDASSPTSNQKTLFWNPFVLKSDQIFLF
ncbi:uncharacterized protein BDV17DRAFT_260032 [Aspergillus undulatus]|uniref:uncharacterized protein n=1 Tax=Aspergillus undulatus TaxID=1810928 RepID=UPI003CCE2DBA